jgi:hypothetical protein
MGARKYSKTQALPDEGVAQLVDVFPFTTHNGGCASERRLAVKPSRELYRIKTLRIRLHDKALARASLVP